MTIERNREEIIRIAARHGAGNVRVFGSVAVICKRSMQRSTHS
jgi:hypothetical protein